MAKEDLSIFETLSDFTKKENWDEFFSLRGTGDSFEWYAEWRDLRDPILSHLTADTVRILVPACGSSRVSEYLYDAGFRDITNIDFSKVVVSDMLRRYIRSRPEMRWRVMDITDMQFADESFDVVLDKGGLDALMEPAVGSILGKAYLKEVRRVLKSGGKFLCLTLAESHIVGLLCSEFRFGWATSIHAISQGPSQDQEPSLRTFMVAVVKEKLGVLKPITWLFDSSDLDHITSQSNAVVTLLEVENQLRSEYSSGEDIIYSVRDLELGAKGNLKELHPGSRYHLILGEQGESIYTYKAVLMDAQPQSDPFCYHCGIFIVPQNRAREWLFTSEGGQWLILESSKAARLVMVFLDSRHSHSDMDDIKKDLSPLVKGLAPGKDDDDDDDDDDDGPRIPFMMAGDGVKKRNTVMKATSETTGPIIIEDVIYAGTGNEVKMLRRLTFGRSSGLVQSEAFLLREHKSNLDEEEGMRNSTPSKAKRKGGRRGADSHKSNDEFKSNVEVDHSYLASSYHTGIVSGFALIAPMLENAVSSQNQVRTIVIGLGAGLLPMFLRGCFPFLDLEVVELDGLILELAKNYFGFVEDEHLKVHIGDGIKFVQEANVLGTSGVTIANEKDNSETHSKNSKTHGGDAKALANTNNSTGIKVLIVDADSSDLSSGLTCPPANFVEESFLLSVKEFLSESGLFVINLVSRSPAIREMVVSGMKKVFFHVFSLELEEEVNEVLFACPMEVCRVPDQLPEAVFRLQELLKIPHPEAHTYLLKMKCLK